jgi:hypothetical protein
MGTDKGICGIGFAAETGAEAAMEDLSGAGRAPTSSRIRCGCGPGRWRRSA